MLKEGVEALYPSLCLALCITPIWLFLSYILL